MTSPKDHLWSLQEEINAYLRFLESGENQEKYPQARNRPVLINIVLNYPIPADCEWFFAKSRSAVEVAGFRLDTRLDAQP